MDSTPSDKPTKAIAEGTECRVRLFLIVLREVHSFRRLIGNRPPDSVTTHAGCTH